VKIKNNGDYSVEIGENNEKDNKFCCSKCLIM